MIGYKLKEWINLTGVYAFPVERNIHIEFHKDRTTRT